MASQSNSVKSIMYALGANFSIAIAKFFAAIYTGSGSMMAEAVHSAADCSNQGLLLLGLKKAKKPASIEHPLGHGKEIYFWSFIVAIMLFSVGGLFSIYEGWHKLSSEEPLSSPWIAVGVLVFAIAAEGASLWGCIVEINKTRGQLSLWQWFKQSRQSELVVVFGEDLAAQLGLIFALCAIGLTMITGNPIYDAIGSIVIGILLIIVAILVGKEVKDLLIGQGVSPDVDEQMRSYMTKQPHVVQVYNMLTMQLGDDVMVAVKAQMDKGLSGIEQVEAINAAEAAFKQQFPQVMWLFFEPDCKD